MNKLSKRLKKIYDIVTGKVVADVGCDHGKLADALLSTKKCDFVYVSDISKASLEKAEKLLENYPNWKSFHCDGLIDYTEAKLDEVVISGMGGDEIMQIIANSPIKVDSYILSPQKNEILVKKTMLLLGYDIVYDIICKDRGKFYHIFKCKYIGKVKNLSEFDLNFGKANFIENNKDFDEFLDVQREKITNFILQVDEEKKSQMFGYLRLISLAKKRKGK